MGIPSEEHTKSQRVLRRCHETSRLEEQLWSLVFEELWPVVTRSTRRSAMAEGDSELAGELGPHRRQARGA